MNKIMLLVIALTTAIGILVLIPTRGPMTTVGPDTSLVVFHTEAGDVTVHVEIANTEREREVGLMNRTFLPENSGMLFVFDREAVLYFWMKNTLIPLDMIFISESMTVVRIEHMTKPCRSDPCPLYPSQAPARYVVEVNGGFAQAHGITVGTTVRFVNVESAGRVEDPFKAVFRLGMYHTI